MEIKNRDKEREQLLKMSLEETREEIVRIDVTIQSLNELKYKNINKISIINQEIDKPIKELTTQKEYLQQLYDDDKQALFSEITDEQRHQAISDKICCVCGGGLSWSCYAEDSYSISCENCEILFAEN